MRLSFLLASLLLLAPGCQVSGPEPATSSDPLRRSLPGYSGAEACARCHEKFHELWATSWHGLAMQVVSPSFLQAQVYFPVAPIAVGDRCFRVFERDGKGFLSEEGVSDREPYPMAYALGGKNVYYFLTRLEKGRLQVLPLAYDVRKQAWFDAMGSMVRHFSDRDDAALDWTEGPLTFNTACYHCHVSQLRSHYDRATDTYDTSWTEPGINCETCHGPGEAHIEAASRLKPGEQLADLRIIRTAAFSSEQMNDLCASCHAKLTPLTDTWKPGERFFDHFNLRSLEDPDFYPDGRDLGENYTFTSWRMSPCLASEAFNCLICHTSSGRMRTSGAAADEICLPCHAGPVRDPAAHSHHPADSEASRCVSCHMPKTEFARMIRHDHSMLPPLPAESLRFGSPNACNLCHLEQDPKWADRWVTQWYGASYQRKYLARGDLIVAARRQDWSRLDDMLAYLTSADRDESFTVALLRLLVHCPLPRKEAPLIQAMDDPSPWVRSAAAEALEGSPTPEGLERLVRACSDESRVVRLAAAAALSTTPLPAGMPTDPAVAQAQRELEASYQVRPDDWVSRYNLGNFHYALGDFSRALKAYDEASGLRADAVAPWVNRALTLARLSRPDEAADSLRRALAIDPRNGAAHFNLGLLLAEQRDRSGAEEHLRRALDATPEFPEAAFNLGVLLAEQRPEESLHWCQEANRLRPSDPKFAYTLAFYLLKAGRAAESISVLERTVSAKTADAGVYALLGAAFEQQGQPEQARQVYRDAAADPRLPPPQRREFQSRFEHP